MLRLRKVLLDYRAALRRVDPQLQVSVLDALKELSRLSMLPTPPSTRARLSEDATRRLATDRPRVAATMRKAADLGQFKYGPGDTPWYGASFATSGDASAAFEDAKALGINVSRACESGLVARIAEERGRRWRTDNAGAIASSNALVEKNGLPLARLRRF